MAVVYVGSADGKLYAFDANGKINCSGTPKTCAPLWTAQTDGAINGNSPVVVSGVVYISSYDTNLYAFDANGKINCSGTPKTCAPLWTAPTDVLDGQPVGVASSPAVANGVVYVGAVEGESLGPFGGYPISFLDAFDANGKINCSGTPKKCAPLWTAPGSIAWMNSTPAVGNGLVYFGPSIDNINSLVLAGYDAAGTRGCSGTPKTCSPLWTSDPVTGLGEWDSSPAVTNGMIYVGGPTDCTFCPASDHNLYAFDRGGRRVWSAPTGGQLLSSPAVANGVVYVGSTNGTFLAFNANTGEQLWTATTGGPIKSSPAIANGMIYIGSDDGAVHAYGLP